ncbi:methyltransferase domain-containing protein [Obelidium mucronatum]|nr:methyltransferase domain-containing protein [Obelidium mucronatum]
MELPTSCSTVPEYIEVLKETIKAYSFLYEHHAVDFYIHNYFNSANFPVEWRDLLESASVQDLIALASHGTSKPEWPKSLHVFLNLIQTVSLQRNPSKETRDMPLKELPIIIKNGMNLKKQHEVAYLSALINSVAESQGIDRIMDIGAGQGYLDICLAFQYNKTVIGVDDDEIQTCGAKRRTDLANKKLYNDGESQGELFHINRRVHAHETFAVLVQEVSDSVKTNTLVSDMTSSQTSGWLLCGLHACGDLTPAIMQHFLDSDANALVCVGCCYNRLTEPKNHVPDRPAGFPLSAYMRSQSPMFHLGFSARNLACQATLRWEEEGGVGNFLRHHYRALLQLVLFENNLMDRARANSKSSTDHDIIIGRMKGPSAFSKGFPFYAKLALSRLRIDTEAEGLTEHKLKKYEESYRHREKEIAIVWTLRSLLGDVFESLLLADRFQYLTEQREVKGLDRIELVPLFDPLASPRNMVIVCTKLSKAK